MDQELQMLISTLYGNKLNEKQLSNIIQMWNSNQNGYLDIMRKQAFAKMPAETNKVNPVAAQRVMNQIVGTTPKLGLSSYKFDKSLGRAANDMSAIANFKEAFRQAHQGGHKTFFWKKTKANPSGMFSTEIVSLNKTEEAAPLLSENVQLSAPLKAKITALLDMNKVNSVMPLYQKPIYNHPYNFDKTLAMIESTKDGLARQFRTNNIPRPMGNPGLNVMGDLYNENYPYSFKKGGVAPSTGNGSFVDTIIEALNNNTDIKTISSLIQQSGLSPEALIQEIVSRAQEGDQAAAMAFSNLEKLMKNSTVAKLGAKLNYINKLKGNCPEGEELVYMKQGGRVCPVCQKKAEKAKSGDKLLKKNAVSDFKEKRKQINPNDTVNTKFGPRDLNGKTKYPKYDAKKENYNFETRMRVQEKDEKSGKKVIGSACGSKMKKK